MKNINSTKTETVEEFKEKVKQAASYEAQKQAVAEKELRIREHRADQSLRELEDSKHELEVQKRTDISPHSQVNMHSLVNEMDDYFEAAKNKMPFLTADFDEIISFHRKNLISVLAPSGHGKSTLTANIARQVIGNTHPISGERRRVLVITNEEAAFDVYNRVCCLINGWNYVGHSKFSQPQIEQFKNFTINAKNNGVMQVIDDSFGGAKGATTTLEGILNIFDRIISENLQYDAILIDYFQNISSSKMDASMEAWRVQEKVMFALDQYKHRISAPIVILAQVRKPQKKGDTYLEPRLIGSKQLLLKSTDVLEIFPNFQTSETEWLVHKSRFNGATGKKIKTRYHAGKIIPMTTEISDI